MITVLFTAQSCQKDGDVQPQPESKLVQTSISGVNGPTSGSVKQELAFDLIWQQTDATLQFNQLTDSASAHTRFIKIFALTNVADSSLKAEHTIRYKFKADSAGTYYLKFYQADNAEKTAIIDTIVIK